MSENKIVIARIFSCPRDTLFHLWNDRNEIEKWYGPEGFQTNVVTYNFREGGKWEFVMTAPDQQKYPIRGVFDEIAPPAEVIIHHGWEADEEESSGVSFTAEFESLDEERTKLILTSRHKTAAEKEKFERMGVAQGWESSFRRIDEIIQQGRAAA